MDPIASLWLLLCNCLLAVGLLTKNSKFTLLGIGPGLASAAGGLGGQPLSVQVALAVLVSGVLYEIEKWGQANAQNLDALALRLRLAKMLQAIGLVMVLAALALIILP